MIPNVCDKPPQRDHSFRGVPGLAIRESPDRCDLRCNEASVKEAQYRVIETNTLNWFFKSSATQIVDRAKEHVIPEKGRNLSPYRMWVVTAQPGYPLSPLDAKLAQTIQIADITFLNGILVHALIRHAVMPNYVLGGSENHAESTPPFPQTTLQHRAGFSKTIAVQGSLTTFSQV
jgi:hypothetical protein